MIVGDGVLGVSKKRVVEGANPYRFVRDLIF